MSRTDELTMTRVTSHDGTTIAYWTSGDGPPLVLVHGSAADHTRWRPVLPYLEPRATVHAMDRRGRGDSGDGAHYDVAREYEDVAAVVDAVAAASGSAVDVLGHSSGGVYALGAATLTPKIRTLVLYEGWPVPDPGRYAIGREHADRIDRLVAENQREAALEVMVREIVGMPDDEFAVYRALPAWEARIAAAHTITRELATPPLDRDVTATITVPVLLLVGEDSPDLMKADYEAVAAALPDCRVVVMARQQHIAMDIVPEIFADRVMTFLRDRR